MYARYLMSCLKNDSFVDIENAVANLGDNIQALAIDYIYNQIGINKNEIVYVKRDFISECRDDVNIIFYSEFYEGNIKERLSFPKNVNVKGIVSAVFYDEIDVLSQRFPQILEFLKFHQPIGCRDEHTKLYLNSLGIESYLTGCFTICFPKRNKIPLNPKTFFVDTPKELEVFIPDYIKNNSVYLTHSVQLKKYPIDLQESNRLDNIAKMTLERYRNEATLVVTGRLHVALPCLAMGIPVILTCNNLDFRFGWIEKFIHPYQLGEYDKINWNPLPVNIENAKNKMINLFKSLLLKDKNSAIKEFRWLDNYYSSRNRVKPYKMFREKIINVFDNYKNKKVKYIIWGAGYHCRYAYEIITEVNPMAQLVAIVDKYRTGEYKGVDIIKPNELVDCNFDHIFITTVPGTKDALEWIEKYKPENKYTFITSQHKS